MQQKIELLGAVVSCSPIRDRGLLVSIAIEHSERARLVAIDFKASELLIADKINAVQSQSWPYDQCFGMALRTSLGLLITEPLDDHKISPGDPAITVGSANLQREATGISNMTKLEDIEKAVEQLPPEELAKFRDWFDELQARLWDQQIERDIKAGKLDWLADEAEAEHTAGLMRKLK